MTISMNGAIEVLVIGERNLAECASPPGRNAVSFRRSWNALTQHPNLHFMRVHGMEEAAARLRRNRADVVLLDRNEAFDEALDWLLTQAPDLPILVIADNTDAAFTCHAVSRGAVDVLTGADLSDGGLRHRLELAIARKGFEARRILRAREDEQTGLANGLLLEERFARAVARADRSATLVGLVAIDLDGIEDVVAEHGRRIAARFLSLVGQRLLAETRQTDTLARNRDHGFTWLVESLPSLDDINVLVDRLPENLARPFAIEGRTIAVTASVGVAICPYHGRDFHTVHGMAEAAMLDVATISGDALLMPPILAVARDTKTPVSFG